MANHSSRWIQSVRTHIGVRMHRNGLEEDEDRNFITHEDLKNAWNKLVDGSSSLTWLRRDLQCLATISDKQLCDSWLRIISTLIWIRYDNWPSLMKKHLPAESTNGACSAKFRDENIPFTKLELGQYMSIDGHTDNEAVKSFFAKQFAFNPIILKQDVQLEFDEKDWRLPLTEEGKPNDTGAYGLVTKVMVAKGHYHYVPSFSNGGSLSAYPEAFYAARKEFDIGYDFARESKNLQILRSSDIQHGRIMQSFTSVVIDQKFNLFFPWGDLDLDRFLTGDYLYKGQDKLVTPSSLIKEAFELLGALQFLHESIQHDGENIVFSHLDLKPNNILVTKDPDRDQYPLGKWKITDFGISSMEPRKDDVKRLVSVRELYVRTNRTSIKTEKVVELERFPGPYQPPEAEETIANMFKRQGRRTPGDKSDIWSYGCIILNILAFALGGPQYTAILSDKCAAGDTCPDGRLRNGYFYRAAVNNSFLVTPDVRKWFEHHANIHGGWLTGIWNVVATEMLKIYPQDRKSARSIALTLKPLVESQLPKKNIWKDPSPPTQPTNPIPIPIPRPAGWRPRRSTSDNEASIPVIHVENGDLPNNSPIVTIDERLRQFSGPADSSLPPESGYNGEWPREPSVTASSEQSGSDLSHSLTRDFRVGAPVALEVSRESLVAVSVEGSSILFQNKDRAKVFLTTEENGHTTFTLDGARTFPRIGTLEWDQVYLAGHYLALRKRATRGNEGQIEIYDLNNASPGQQIRWTNRVQNKDVNAICVSIRGFVAFRYSKGIGVFDFNGAPRINTVSPQALSNLSNGGVKDIAFDGTGRVLIVLSSNHWFMQNLEDASGTLMSRHEFRGHEGTDFRPRIIPFTRATGFVLHDIAYPGRCAVMLPRLGTQSQFQEYHFDLSHPPHAIAITPDNNRLVYVTITKKPFHTKHNYILRSRVINAETSPPISHQDTTRAQVFVERKLLRISIAAVNTSGGYVILAALEDGRVHCFTLA